jgi:hypothetical protein
MRKKRRPKTEQIEAVMRYAYETLLHLYPDSYRAVFAREMAEVFDQATADYQPLGVLRYLAFLWTEFTGLITGAFSMWTDEYVFRTRLRLRLPFLLSLLAGAAITAFFQNDFYIHVAARRSDFTPVREAPPLTPDLMLPLILAGGTLLFISLFSLAFVWNMRIIGIRAGRLKPIWMPGRANARTARRDQTLHRNPGRQRRELQRRIR